MAVRTGAASASATSRSSSKEVSTSARVSGLTRRMPAVAETPSPPGMRRLRTATSGRSVSARCNCLRTRGNHGDNSEGGLAVEHGPQLSRNIG